MNILDPTFIRDNVDYSFGDQSGHHLVYGYMKSANINNIEFLNKYEDFKKNNKIIMTLFIDNIRLYYRNAKLTNSELINEESKRFKLLKLEEFKDQDLLKLCSQLTDMNFLIFTGFEDTQIDEEIFNRVPANVLGIYASNCISFGGKVHPIPYGIQRKLFPSDYRHDVLLKNINTNIETENLLYINHSLGANRKRLKINEKFEKEKYVKIDHPTGIDPNSYQNYLTEIKKHKFMLCCDGNAIGCECSRDWEVLYMRRVPVLEKSKYLEKIFEGIPVLFVDSFFNITEDLLIKNNHLFESMKTFDLSKLDIKILYNNILKKYDINIS
jgi:hypothetical protein